MNANTLVEQLLADASALECLPQPLDDDVATMVVEQLKQEADRHAWINANRSLELAAIIIQIGQARDDRYQTALGMMARGDALRFLGQIEEAWATLELAGQLFLQADHEIGWARTRIGRLGICVDLNRVGQALAEAERARTILTSHQVYEKRLTLDLNTAVVYDMLGEHHRALALYQRALATAETLGEVGQMHIGLLGINIGITYEALGNFRQALASHERARTHFQRRNEIRGVGNAERNIAAIALAQGDYRRALDLFHRVYDLKAAEQLPLDAAHVKRDIVECYLLLNRYAEARDLAEQTSAEFEAFGAGYERALTLLALAVAEAQLGQFAAAQAALNSAEPIFESLGATAWIATTRLRRGRIALQQGDAATAGREALAAAACFAAGGQQVDYATATLLKGQAQLALDESDAATVSGISALQVARRCNVPALRYAAHLLLGRVAEVVGRPARAQRRYSAAAATVERVQRGLTITLRPGFLEDKGEALRALIALHLRHGRAERALEALERAKSQVMLNHLANRQHLRWVHHDPRSRALIEELDQLREEHQWFYRLAHGEAQSERAYSSALDPQRALAEVAARERRMRAITEQLYLGSGVGRSANQVSVPSPRDIRETLYQDTLLIEFYNDGAHLWAFTLDAHTLEVHLLPVTVAELDRLLAQLQTNLAFALGAGPATPTMRNLTGLAQRILQRLYAALLEPLAPVLRGRRRLAIVPYGALHYLPFHLLHTGAQYLIEQHEVVILPTAGLMTYHGPRRAGGALVLAHSWDGRLPQTHAEGQIVQSLFGGELRQEQAARRTALQAQPTKILHIAAHAEHRLDQPDLSYIQLADGQLYTDDLLQHDMSYELVTLSACETGRANVAAGDELIGIGRGFLYAGAGALIASLWRVTDGATITLMEYVYQALRSGAAKSAALRNAQRAMLADDGQLHPAFWGAFQLVGDARPLSPEPHLISQKEYTHAICSTVS